MGLWIPAELNAAVFHYPASPPANLPGGQESQSYYIYSTMESVFTERNHSIAIRPCFDCLSRDRSGGSSVIRYHLPQSVSVFVRELFRRSADQMVVAQPGANARRWEHIFWGVPQHR